MAEEYSRAMRVAEQVQRELSDLIHRDLRDPALYGITVTHVDMSSDLRNAKVFISRLDRAAGVENTEKGADFGQAVSGLNGASGYLRGQLGKRLRMRGAPLLTFVADHALDKGDRITQLINASRNRDNEMMQHDEEPSGSADDGENS